MLNRKKFYTLVGKKLQELRKLYCLEVSEISDLFGMSVENYVEYELGYPIPLHLLTKISYWFNCKIEVFLPKFNECDIFWVLSKGEGVQGNIRYVKTPVGTVKQLPIHSK